MILEHIHTPTKAIDEFHRIIKPNGVVKIIVPHCSHFSALLAEQHICQFNTEYFFKRVSDKNVWGKEIKTWSYIRKDKRWNDVKVTIVFPKGMLTILSWPFQKIFNINRIMQQTYENLVSCFYRAHELHVELRNKK
jgi:ubiquinone/menaquinone biosynthesis C-methylase UbiE